MHFNHELTTRKVRSLLVVTLTLLAVAIPALGEEHPLPAWFFYGGGNGGVADGSSSSPDNVNLTAQVTQNVPMAYATAVAQSSETVLVITSNTTYRLRFAAAIAGIGSGAALFLDDSGTITSANVSGSTWKTYTNTFTTGGPGDIHVGQNLRVQLLLNRFAPVGTTTGTYTNIRLHVETAQPALTVRMAGAGQIQLQWLTNFSWYVPETAPNVFAGMWDAVTNSPTVQSNQFVIQLGVQPGANFFRLRQQ